MDNPKTIINRKPAVIQRAILAMLVTNTTRAGRSLAELSFEQRDEALRQATAEWHKLCTEIRPPLPEVEIAQLICEGIAARSPGFAQAFREEEGRMDRARN